MIKVQKEVVVNLDYVVIQVKVLRWNLNLVKKENRVKMKLTQNEVIVEIPEIEVNVDKKDEEDHGVNLERKSVNYLMQFTGQD